jgi:hypothetical protein
VIYADGIQQSAGAHWWRPRRRRQASFGVHTHNSTRPRHTPGIASPAASSSSRCCALCASSTFSLGAKAR